MTSSPVAARLPASIPELLDARAASTAAAGTGYRELLPSGSWRAVRWPEVRRLARALSRTLARAGVQKGDFVVLLAASSVEWEICHHAILYRGAIVTAVDPQSAPATIHALFRKSGARHLIVQSRALLDQVGEPIRSGLASIHFLEGESGGPGLLDEARETGRDDREPLDLPGPSDPATLVFTSGTTGEPKGILYTHRQVLLACRTLVDDLLPRCGHEDSTVSWLPLAHLYQRLANLALLWVGGTIHVFPDPATMIARMREARPTIFAGVPRFYEKVYDEAMATMRRASPIGRAAIGSALRAGEERWEITRDGGSPAALLRARHAVLDRIVLRRIRSMFGDRIRILITGSAPTPVPVLRFFHSVGLDLIEAYALSENVIPMAANRPGATRVGTVGRPFSRDQEVRIASDGEILVRGEGVFGGYLGESPELTRGHFTGDGFYRTGDLGALDPDGFLRITGRKAEIIKTSTGRKVSPLGVETAYRDVPWVDRVVAVGDGRKHLVGLVSLKEAPRDREVLTEHFERAGMALPPHERLRGILVVDAEWSVESGMLTPSLKLRRRAIEERYESAIDALYREIESGAQWVIRSEPS
jgi:long-chain acyl-CoA synthetase